MKPFAEFRESVYYRTVVARAAASGMQPKLYVGRYLGHHARTGSILIMTTEGVVKVAGFRRMNEEDRWNVEMSSLGCNRNGREAEAAEAIQAPRPQVIHLPLTPRRRCVTRADLRKYGVTMGCSASSDIAVHGKTSKPHTRECRNWIGEQTEHDPEGHGRLYVHKRRRDVELEIPPFSIILWPQSVDCPETPREREEKTKFAAGDGKKREMLGFPTLRARHSVGSLTFSFFSFLNCFSLFVVLRRGGVAEGRSSKKMKKCTRLLPKTKNEEHIKKGKIERKIEKKIIKSKI